MKLVFWEELPSKLWENTNKLTIVATIYPIYNSFGIIIGYNNEYLIISVCVCVGEWCGQQNLSMMDRQWKGHCCLSIHLRCTWKSSTMTAHPSDMGVQLSLLEQNQALALSIMHPVCSLHSDFCWLVLQNLAGGSRGSTGLLCMSSVVNTAPKLSKKTAEGGKGKHKCI